MVRSSPGLKPKTDRGEGIELGVAGETLRCARAGPEKISVDNARIASAVGGKYLLLDRYIRASSARFQTKKRMHSPATAGGTDLDSKMSDQSAAKSSTRRGPHI